MRFNVSFFRALAMSVALSLLSVTPSGAQVNLKLGGGIGIMSPASDFGGSTNEYYDGSRFGFGSGLNVQGKAKLGLAGFDLAGEVDYASVSNTGNSEPGQGSVEISQKVLSLKVGPEFRFALPLLPLTPYIGVNLALNKFTGETTFRGVSKVPSATYSVSDATRLGVGFMAGTEVSAGPFLALDFVISYNLMNIVGREWIDANPATNQRIDSYLALNDASDPQYAAGDDKHVVAHARSIHSILFTVSILFGL